MEYLVYNDKLWKPYMTFDYVGHPEEFTLQPDTYLFVANGARGGITKNPFISWGGTTYGILDLDHEQTMYAVVGGNGEDPRNKTSKTADVINIRAKGGYNGGGEGGLAWSPNSYDNGAAGGGATDVRLAYPSIKSIPDEYDQVEYIEANGTQYIDLNYFFNTNISKFEMVVDLRDPTTIPDGEKDMVLCGSRDSSNNMIVMYRVDYSNISQYGVGSNWLRGSSFPFGTKFRIVVTGQRLFAWYDMNGTQLGSISMENYSFTMTRSAYVFKYQNSDGSYDRKTYGKLYSFKIYENGVLKRYYIPFKSKPDAETQTAGLYDIINGVAYTSPIGDPFVCGNVVEKTEYRDDYDEHSLLTRFFVAGGGGGSCNMYNQDYVQDFLSFGGGARSGWVSCYDAGSEHNIWKSATQDSGFSFCYGAAAQNRSYGGNTWGYEGQAGGGGGWYGGYAVINRQSASIAYSACNGSGGSSYVLTADSYKPEHYMESFEDVMPTLYFRDFLMLPYQAFNGPSLVIYKEARGVKSVGDIIRVPYTGREEVIKIIPGTYRVKCYGGDGAVRYRCNKTGKGGYVEGVLSINEATTMYANVGSSAYIVGMGTNGANHDVIFSNRMAYNVRINTYDALQQAATMGGGATDLRWSSAENGDSSLLTRIIVAGGGGGSGCNWAFGGNGGGSSGEWPIGGGWGDNSGPGTQSSGNAFGKNGIGVFRGNGFGGSGGNGWYGGGGTTPDGSGDDDQAGSGGSGYVLTADSYRPTGYDPPEKFYFDEPTLTTGGNPVRGMTQMLFEAESLQIILFIAQDEESYKSYNVTINEWEPINVSELTPEIFENYGCSPYEILSDTGLLQNYRFIVYDKMNKLKQNPHVLINVLPPKQYVVFSESTQAEVLDMINDYDKDENTDIEISYGIEGQAENRRLVTTVSFDMHQIPITNNTVYVIQFKTRERPSSYYYPRHREPTPGLSLLPVGTIGYSVPSKYKTHIGPLMPDGTTAITSVNCSSSCEYKRNIYTASLLNNSVIRFTRYSIVSDKAYIIQDNIPKSELNGNGYVGGSLLIDGKYMYLINSKNYDTNVPVKILRVPINGGNYTSYTAPSGNDSYANNCYGKAFWLTPNQIAVSTKMGFCIFNTSTLTFSATNDPDGAVSERNDFVVGKYSIWTFWYNTECGSPRVYDRETTIKQHPVAYTMEKNVKCGCFYDGKFYITQKSHIYVFTDRPDYSMILDEDIITPYSTLTPKSISCYDGILYITFESSQLLYMYDIKEKTWYSTKLPFNVQSYSPSYNYRPAGFESFFFIGQLKLYVTNYDTSIKYRIGQKSSLLYIDTRDTSHCVYNENFVTVDENGIDCHIGNLEKDLTLIDDENKIYASSYIIKELEYKQFFACSIDAGEEEDDEQG